MILEADRERAPEGQIQLTAVDQKKRRQTRSLAGVLYEETDKVGKNDEFYGNLLLAKLVEFGRLPMFAVSG